MNELLILRKGGAHQLYPKNGYEISLLSFNRGGVVSFGNWIFVLCGAYPTGGLRGQICDFVAIKPRMCYPFLRAKLRPVFFKRSEHLLDANHPDSLKILERQQMAVSGDDKVGSSIISRRNNHVVFWVLLNRTDS